MGLDYRHLDICASEKDTTKAGYRLQLALGSGGGRGDSSILTEVVGLKGPC